MSYNESLKSNSNYPMMTQSQWDSSPWNQSDPKDMDFEVTCSQSISKTVIVTTNNYASCTSDTDWAEEYHSNDYHTPLQLIRLLGEVLQKDLVQGIVFKNPKFTENLIKECEGWTADETEFIEN